ncbi:MAG: hypothetical protein K2N25_01980 [Muribaculaceae bacterium]|nr:hypothetical protein [Muribaculaceae bacterium]
MKLKSVISVSFCMLLCCLFAACKGNASNGANSTERIEFETLEGVIKKTVSFADASYDSISVEYNIDWPVKGNEEILAYVQNWIVEQMTAKGKVKTVKTDIREVLDMIADEMNSEEAPFTKSIKVTALENTPFDSFMTINFFEESSEWLANYPEYRDVTLSIRLSDGKVFQPENAIGDERKIRRLIGKYLRRQYEEEDPNWVWSDEIEFSDESNMPLPYTPISLTTKGILVSYVPGEISTPIAGGFSCIVPYEEVKPALSESALEFLYGNDSAKNDSNLAVSTEANERKPFSMSLAGKIDGKYAVEMHMEGYRTQEGIYPESGKYCYTKYKAWIEMNFEVEKANDFKIYAYTDGRLTGTWDVYFDDKKDSLIGYLTNYKGVTYPVELKVVQ